MTKRTRFILFVFFLAAYLVLAPVLIFYSLGYRFDFENSQVFTTGGFYLKIWPTQVQIAIDDKTEENTGMFSNEALIQGLSGGKYKVSVSKNGYFEWQKNLSVKQEQITSIPNVTLIKQKISLEKMVDKAQAFSVSPDNTKIIIGSEDKEGTKFSVISAQNKNEIASVVLPASKYSFEWSDDSLKILILGQPSQYYIFDYGRTEKNLAKSFDFSKKNISNVSFDPSNSSELIYLNNNSLYGTARGLEPLVKNALAYAVYDKKIYWLSDSGYVFSSTLPVAEGQILNTVPFTVKTRSSYKIFIMQNLVFLQENKNLFLLDKNSKTFGDFYGPINNLELSPDSSKIVYFNDHEIFYSDSETASERIFLQRFSDKIIDCFWLNNGYLALNVSGKIKISETDSRDRLNIIDLSDSFYPAPDTSLQLENPGIFFDYLNKNLYILNKDTLFKSEPLTDKSNK